MGDLHPHVVHFAIALLVVGVLLRAVSFFGRPAFVNPAATTLLVLGTLAAFAATFTGDAAHGPVEQMPGLRPVVEEHEAWGVRARNIFFIVLIAEALALAMRRSPKAHYALMTSMVVSLVGLFALYEAAEHGGEIVYAYGGGVGTRGGDPAHAANLLRAGLYQQALVERKAGRAEEAAALLEFAAARFRDDVEVQLLRAESLLLDRKDAQAALAALQAVTPPPDNRAIRTRHALLAADALEAAGQREGAIATLQQLLATFPSERVQQRLDALKGTPATSP